MVEVFRIGSLIMERGVLPRHNWENDMRGVLAIIVIAVLAVGGSYLFINDGDPEAALTLTDSSHISGVERYYDYGRPVDPVPIDRAIERNELLPTGGSDAHDDVLGRAGLDREAFAAVRARL